MKGRYKNMSIKRGLKSLSKLDKFFIILCVLAFLGSMNGGLGAVLKSGVGLAFWYIICRFLKKWLSNRKKVTNTSANNDVDTKPKKESEAPNNEYVIIHTDTTGLDPECDEIIRVTALRVINGKIFDTYSTLVKPSQEIDEDITEKNGITNEMVETAPDIYGVLTVLKDFIKDNDVLVGYNVNFYYKFLKHYFHKELSIDFKHTLIDVMNLSDYILKSRISSKKIVDVAKTLKIDMNSFDPATRNAYTCFEIFEHFRNKTILENGKWNINFLKDSSSISGIKDKTSVLKNEKDILKYYVLLYSQEHNFEDIEEMLKYNPKVKEFSYVEKMQAFKECVKENLITLEDKKITCSKKLEKLKVSELQDELKKIGLECSAKRKKILIETIIENIGIDFYIKAPVYIRTEKGEQLYKILNN